MPETEKHALFEVGQLAVIKNSEGKVLILESKGKWVIPGGRINEGEGWEDAFAREIFEETGIREYKIEKIVQVGVSDDYKKYFVTFLCSVDNSEIRLSSEHQSFRWIGIEELDNYEFWHENIKTRIKNAFSNV